MLKDFLEANGIDAELIGFKSETPMQKALRETHTPVSKAVRAEFFLNESEKEFLVIYPLTAKLDFQKIKHLTSSKELNSFGEEEVFEATGYKKGMLPPVGIYGVSFFLDKSLHGKEYVFCRVGEKQYLKISPEEIIKSNKDAKVENITKTQV